MLLDRLSCGDWFLPAKTFWLQTQRAQKRLQDFIRILDTPHLRQLLKVKDQLTEEMENPNLSVYNPIWHHIYIARFGLPETLTYRTNT